MAEKVLLEVPTTEKRVRELKLGSEVYLTGRVHIMRFRAISRFIEMMDRGEQEPVDLKDGAIHFSGPIARRVEEGYKVFSTAHSHTVMPYVRFDRLIRDAGLRIILGKAGLHPTMIDAMKECGAAYLAGVGGVGSLYAQGIRKVRDVFWEDLSLQEALFVLDVENFGPFWVAIDSQGNSLFAENAKERERRRKELFAEVGIKAPPPTELEK